MNLCDRKLCTGCGACRNRCPRQAIDWAPDAEGFYYPNIDTAKCINCGLCVKACPVLTPPAPNPKQEKVLAARARDKTIRQASSSGGIFSVLAINMLRRGGVVSGVSFNHELNACHLLVENEIGLAHLRGSKYVQSETGDVYNRIEAQLKSGRPVLFTGTPCQIAGLRAFLGKEHPLLVTCDIVCHGVPSPGFFKVAVADQYNWMVGQTADFRFRDLKGWGMSPALIPVGGRPIEKFFKKDYYFQAFLEGMNYRESCYHCPYASLSRQADITIGDFWGLPFMFRFKHNMFCDGCSLVMCNTEKGKMVWNLCRESVSEDVFSVETCKENTQLFRPTARPAIRDAFYEMSIGEIKSLPELHENMSSRLLRPVRRILRALVHGLSRCYAIALTHKC